MLGSQTHILTTHVGSLPRPAALSSMLIQREQGVKVDALALKREIKEAVTGVIDQQLAAGVDVGNNGEQPRVGFSTYVANRMSGFGGQSRRPTSLDSKEFPDYALMLEAQRSSASMIDVTPQALHAISYTDLSDANEECNQFLQLSNARTLSFAERFMTAASPGIIATTMMNAHYESHAAYVDALAQQMRKEYELIHKRGLLLQIDCPDLAMERTRFFQDLSLIQFLEMAEMHIDAINRATINIPADRIRLHVCWGNSSGPHIHDVPLKAILPLLYKAKVGALSIELANPRHQHEYKVFKTLPLPDSMLLLPGVIDSTVNYVEHPEVVADRIIQVVDAIGDRSRVIASTDCGFGTFAGAESVAASVVWYKLHTLHEGATLASKHLW